MPADQPTSRRARAARETTTRRHTSLTPKVAVARRGHAVVNPGLLFDERPAVQSSRVDAPESGTVPASTIGHVSPRAVAAPRGSFSVEGLRATGRALRSARRFAV